MLPFAAVLAIVALGQTLVVHAGRHRPVGRRLGVARHRHRHPPGLRRQRQACCRRRWSRSGSRVLAGLLNGLLDRPARPQPDRRHAGHQRAALRRRCSGISGGTPRQTTDLLASIAGGETLGIPHSVVLRGRRRRRRRRSRSSARWPAAGSRRSAPTRAAGVGDRPDVNRHRAGGYVWAQVLYWLGGLLLAGIINKPTAFQGDATCSPRSPPSCSAARRCWAVAATWSPPRSPPSSSPSSSQFVLALGVTFAVQTLVAGRGPRHRRRALHRRLAGAAAPPQPRSRPAPVPAPPRPAPSRSTARTAPLIGSPATERPTRMSRPSTTAPPLGGRECSWRSLLSACGGSDRQALPQRIRRHAPRPPTPRAWCGREEDHPRPHRRLRRQQLAPGHDRVGQGRDRQVPERHELHVRRRPGQHAEGHLRHPGHGRQGRQRDRRLPRRRPARSSRRCAAPTRPA